MFVLIPRRGGLAGQSGGATRLLACNNGGSGAENLFEAGVDGGFDVDGVVCGFGMYEGHVYIKGDAEHGFTSAPEFGGGAASADECILALTYECEDAGEEDDVFAVELETGGVILEAVELRAV